jgi:hypothetical protein
MSGVMMEEGNTWGYRLQIWIGGHACGGNNGNSYYMSRVISTNNIRQTYSDLLP